jgi:hypothetical protein
MKNLFLILVSIIMVSCNNNDEPTPQPIPTPVPFVPVTITPSMIAKRNDKGPTDGISNENFIISNDSNWTNIKNLMDAPYIAIGLGNYYTNQYFTETTINFNNFTVIAVFDQVYGTGGHSIDITNITEYEDNIVVTVENLQTGNFSSVVTQPYHIVKIPKATKPIVFE